MKFVARSVVDRDKEEAINTGDNEQGSSTTKPSEDYDPRTLYERLQEQRTIKEELFQEATRLSNLVKRIDDDEAEYFRTLSETQRRLELEQKQKEQEELEAYRKAVASSTTTTIYPHPTSTAATNGATKTSPLARKNSKTQKKGLEGLVVLKKKRTADEAKEDKETNEEEPEAKKSKTITTTTISSSSSSSSGKASTDNKLTSLLAAYSDESSSDED